MERNKVLQFAKAELRRYLEIGGISDSEYEIDIGIEQGCEDDEEDRIWIDVIGPKGVIKGSNPRAALIAVYRFLNEYGFHWIRAGKTGEICPSCIKLEHHIAIRETAAYKHRGICIEGAVSFENVRDMIDYIPKIGMNAYFFQFRESHTFFDKWYQHASNPKLTPEDFPPEKARSFIALLEQEIEKRGLIYHAVGHGWTCESFGIPGLGWDHVQITLPEETKKCLALVNGKRELWEEVPLMTNLCYSNPEVLERITRSVVEYCQEKPQVDVVHVWLSDGRNNFCECPDCASIIPADQYVALLNKIDEALTKAQIKTKIVFLIYFDLLWPPITEKLKNQDRFILMFAPITRTYAKSFDPQAENWEIPAYRRNQLEFPASIEENLAFLRGWQAIFSGDAFDYDYHFLWEMQLDLGQETLAKTLWQDIGHFHEIGLNGLVSCQTQRSFFPTGLGVYLMGKALWNPQLSYEACVMEYYCLAFGEEAPRCHEYLEKISALFDLEVIDGRSEWSISKAQSFRSAVYQLVQDFAPVIRHHLDCVPIHQKVSWRLLEIQQDLVEKLATLLESVARQNRPEINKLWQEITEYLQDRETEMQPYFDLYYFILTWEGRLDRISRKVLPDKSDG